MNTQRGMWLGLALLGSVAVAIVACSGAKGQLPPGQGQLAVTLVDAPNVNVDQIWVNIDHVVAHSETSGWVTIKSFSPPLAVDLLTLQTQSNQSADLGFINLPAGKITQIRLVVAPDGNYVMTGMTGGTGGVQTPLKVPSGSESGIKIIGPWDLPECNRTAVTLDFDGLNSIHLADTGDAYNLRPVIRAKKSATIDVGCTTTPPVVPDAGTDTDAGTDAGTTTPPPPPPPPPPAGAGTACVAPADCLSGVCSGTPSTCALSAAGAPCKQDTDCVSKSCSPDGTCATGTAGGFGTACTQPSDCMSNSCNTSGTCDPSNQGQPCLVANDCYQGLICSDTAPKSCVPLFAL
jgi:Domain of unknown function (DUF4382)